MDEDHTRCVDDDQVSSAMPSRGSDGQLEIFRPKRGSVDLFRAYHVTVNGDDMGEVRRGHSRRLRIAPGIHEVHLVIDWCRSPSIDIDVASGETVKLLCWPKFQFWQTKTALANPDEWIVLAHSADVDG